MAWLEKGERRKVIARNSGNPFAAATARLLGDALTCIERNQEPPTSARRALEIVRLVDALYASAASGNAATFSVAPLERPSS
jgi:predicted dehydrogenase